MKKIIAILAVIILVSCKKKETTPVVIEPTCETPTINFAGKYRYVQGNQDTIEIVFVSNNCPNKTLNTYLVKGLGKAVQPILNSGQTFEIKDYTIKLDEGVKSGNYADGSFGFSLQSSGLNLNCNKLQYQSTQFVKI